MDERILRQPGNSLEQDSRSKILKRSLGYGALLLAGGWAAKKYSPKLRSSTTEFLGRIHLIEEEGHTQSTALFSSLARSFGVNVTESHTGYWRTMLTVGRALDTIVDESQPEDIDKEALALICGQPIAGLTSEVAQEFSSILHSASDERRGIILDGLQVNEYAKKLKETTGIEEMLRLRDEEAVLYTRIMTLDNPDQDPAIASFNAWLLGLGKAGYHLDTLLDLASDYKENVTDVQPTPAAYAAVVKRALLHDYPTLLELPGSAYPRLALTGVQKMTRSVLRNCSQKTCSTE